jgi:hypothetical protein
LSAGAGTNYWLPTNLADFPEVAADVTAINSNGTPQAFALSLADVARLSTPAGPFPNGRARIGGHHTTWMTRTPTLPGESSNQSIWSVVRFHNGGLNGHRQVGFSDNGGGVRPAIIVHP